MTEYVPGEGDVEIKLSGETLYLKPTLDACLRLSRTNERGPVVLSEQCLALNFDTICFVLAAGLGTKPEEIQQRVFDTGTVNLYGKAVRFIHIVSNGGRPEKPLEGKDALDPPPSS